MSESKTSRFQKILDKTAHTGICKARSGQPCNCRLAENKAAVIAALDSRDDDTSALVTLRAYEDFLAAFVPRRSAIKNALLSMTVLNRRIRELENIEPDKLRDVADRSIVAIELIKAKTRNSIVDNFIEDLADEMNDVAGSLHD